MTTFYQELCVCGHQRQLHKFPQHSYARRFDGGIAAPWGKDSNDPGCRVGHKKFMIPAADGVFTVPHQGDECPCKEFEAAK
jgi:hypothetical protein